MKFLKEIKSCEYFALKIYWQIWVIMLNNCIRNSAFVMYGTYEEYCESTVY